MEEVIEMPQSAFPAIEHVFHSSGKQEYYRRLLQVQNPNQYYVITEEDIDRLFLEFEAKGVGHAHKRSVEYLINMFLEEAAKEHQGKYVFTMKDLKDYLAIIRREYSVSYYRKNVTYLKKLFRIAGIDLAGSLKAPQEIDIDLTIVTVDDIKNLIQLVEPQHFSNKNKAEQGGIFHRRTTGTPAGVHQNLQTEFTRASGDSSANAKTLQEKKSIKGPETPVRRHTIRFLVISEF